MSHYDNAGLWALLLRARWPGGVSCPRCHQPVRSATASGLCAANACEVPANTRWKCSRCRKVFSLTVGTVLEGSKLPFDLWAKAITLLCQHPRGLAAAELSDALGITRKSALSLMRRMDRARQGGDLARAWRRALRDAVVTPQSGSLPQDRMVAEDLLRQFMPSRVRAVSMIPAGTLPPRRIQFRITFWPLSFERALNALLQPRPV